MSSAAKHSSALNEDERPAKRVRVDGIEEDEEDVPVVSKLNGPQKASDLYLDTVRLPQGHSLLCFFSQYAYRSTELS